MKKLLTYLLTFLGLQGLTSCQVSVFENADVKSFAAFLDEDGVVLLDVRTKDEFLSGHLSGALLVDVKQPDFLASAQKVIPAGSRVAVYCQSGKRSALAAQQLAKAGFSVTNLTGGIMQWQAEQKPITLDPAEVDAFLTPSGKVLRFHALIHASIRFEYDGKEYYIDPVQELGGRIVDFSILPQADYLLVTHEHSDHFDAPLLSQLSKPETQLVTNARCAEQLGYGQVMQNGDTLKFDNGVVVEAVPAYNTTEGHLQFHPKGRDNGYILTIDGLRIYIAGDTEDIPEMSNLKNIDIALLPCNQPYTMLPEQLVNAARTIRPKVLFPYHYGDTDVTGLPDELADDGIEVRIRHYE